LPQTCAGQTLSNTIEHCPAVKTNILFPKEWDEHAKLRAQVEMLNGDDALELFKKTLSWACLIQLAKTSRMQQRRATKILRRGMSNNPRHLMHLRAILLGLKSGSRS